MNGNLLYELARQRAEERRRVAQEAGEARRARAAARARRRDAAPETVVARAIPDYAHEMFEELRDDVPAPRQQDRRGRHARTSR